jgi:hypothetical protein
MAMGEDNYESHCPTFFMRGLNRNVAGKSVAKSAPFHSYAGKINGNSPQTCKKNALNNIVKHTYLLI